MSPFPVAPYPNPNYIHSDPALAIASFPSPNTSLQFTGPRGSAEEPPDVSWDATLLVTRLLPQITGLAAIGLRASRYSGAHAIPKWKQQRSDTRYEFSMIVKIPSVGFGYDTVCTLVGETMYRRNLPPGSPG
jgi:hypothetical protein